MKKLTLLFAAMVASMTMLFADEVKVTKTVNELYPDVANATQEATLYSDDYLTISVNDDGNNGKIYNKNTEWRLYQTDKAVVTVKATNATLKSVQFTFTSNKGGILRTDVAELVSGEAITVSSDEVTFEVANSGTATNGQILVTGFEVVYDAGEAVEHKYTVTYDLNGGAGEVADATEYDANAEVTVSSVVPTRENYDFAGWLYGEQVYQAGDKFNITADVTLVAQWDFSGAATEYVKVTDAASLAAGQKLLFVNEAAKKVAGALEGKILSAKDVTNLDIENGKLYITEEEVAEFVLGGSEEGWTLTSGELQLTETKVKELANGEGTWTISIADGNATIKASNPLRYNKQAPRFTTYASGQEDIQLYRLPVADDGKLRVTYDVDGKKDVVVLDEAGEITLAEAPADKEGYAFAGWKNGENTYQPGDKFDVTANITFVAAWEAKNYEVSVAEVEHGVISAVYDLAGALIAEGEKKELPYGTVITLQAEPDADYQLVSWQVTGATVEDNSLTVGAEPVVISAVFKGAVYTVTYDLNGGEGEIADANEYEKNAEVVVTDKVPTREKYNFEGWEYNSEVLKAGDKFQIEENVTLVAKWSYNGPMLHYVRVTATEQLTAGSQILIVSEANAFAAGSLNVLTNGNSYLQKVDLSQIDLEKGTLDIIEEEVLPFVLEGDAEGWNLKTADGLLYVKENNNNRLAFAESVDAKWAISFDESGELTVKYGEVAKGRMLYNNSSPRFSNYASTSTILEAVQLYKLDDNKIYVYYEVDGKTTFSVLDEAGEVELAAAPEAGEGRTFAGWLVDGELHQPGDKIQVTKSISIKAQWNLNKYEVSVSAVENGTIAAAYGESGALAEGEKAEVEFGTVISLTATEDTENYKFAGWQVTGAEVADAKALQTTLTVGAAAVAVSASFEYVDPAKAYTIAEFIEAKPEEAVTLVDLTVLYSDGKRTWVIDEEGTVILIYSNDSRYAEVAAGSVLSGQTGTYSDNNGRQDEIIPVNTVTETEGTTATPKDVTEKLTEADVNQYVRYASVEITLKDGKYYIFGDIQIYDQFGFGLKAGMYSITGVFFKYGSILEFVLTEASVDKSEYTVTIADTENGTVVADKSAYLAGETVKLTITPDAGYELLSITVPGVEVNEANEFVMPAQNVTVTVVFKQIGVESFEITVNDADNGVVTATPNKAQAGDLITLIVIANDDYQLKSIEAVAGSEKVNLTETADGDYTFTMPAANVVVTAAFEQIPGISLAQFIEDKPETEVKLVDLTVLASDGKNTYVIDADGVALLMFDQNKTFYKSAIETGKVLKGQKATYKLYKNQVEIIPTAAATVADGTPAVPTVLAAQPTIANENQYIRLENVEVKKDGNKYYAFDKAVQMYAAISSFKITEEGVYNVEGVLINFEGTQLELCLTVLPEKVSDLPTSIDDVEALDVNAPMYNTLGQRVGADYKGIVIQNGKKFILK